MQPILTNVQFKKSQKPPLSKAFKTAYRSASSRIKSQIGKQGSIKLGIAITLALIAVYLLLNKHDTKPADRQSWWKHSTIYQIFPRSFQDSDGDGNGDIQGITSRLEYLKELGVEAAWLSPIYKSPQVDAGYDISDFKALDELYGTMEDFEELVAKAKDLNIKIIMDFVPNHSSDLHVWFQKSIARDPEYEDYYLWADGPNMDHITPPNNWLSVFKYSGWTWNAIRKQWYFHQFSPQQPDFNFRNPKVVEEMMDVMKFWLDKGVYGFRLDAAPHLVESLELKDEPPAGRPNYTEVEYHYLDHIYTRDQPETYDVIYKFRSFIDAYNDMHPDEDERILMTESVGSLVKTMIYYGEENRPGAHFSFNFEMFLINNTCLATQVVFYINEWMKYMPQQYVPNWSYGNHDSHRVASRVGPEDVDGFNMLIAMLPGVIITYNGEEIGMEDGEVTWEQGQDPGACNGPPEKFNSTSRDFGRTPFHWDCTKNAGFSLAAQTWLPVSEKYKNNNLEQQRNENNSHLRIYQAMMKLRKESKVLRDGKLEASAFSERTIVVRRYLESGEAMTFLFNIGKVDDVVDLEELYGNIGSHLQVVLSSNNTRGVLNSKTIRLQPHEATIVKTQ